MCDPVSLGIAAATVGSASAIMGFQGANQMSHENANAANLTQAVNYNALAEQGAQVDAQQSENSVSALIERAKAGGAISASASASGSSGATATALANASDNQVGRALSIEDLNSANQRLQIQNQVISGDVQRKNKIASVPAGNPLSLVLGIAKAGLEGSSAYTSAGGKFGS